MNNLGIVVIGYNRIQGMLRLLRSLENAEYNGDQVTLIVSLDNCGDDSVAKEARAFKWSHGEMRVRTFPERQGLRNHILSCGDFLKEFDAVAVLEDDIVVAPGYYSFMKQAVNYYKDNEQVAGISLYSHKINVDANVPFVPQPGSKDVFFLQFAQSWGQVWMKNQWFEFKKWYLENRDCPVEATNVPTYVSGWPKTSWLKYHIKYCIEKKKYFVYPYDSLTTCFSDVGEHCKEANTRFQVPMSSQINDDYRFADITDDAVIYDAFFEREHMGHLMNLPDSEVCMDLYGVKENREHKRYWITQKAMPFKIIHSFGMEMRPHECNIYNGIAGDVIRVYDTAESEQIRKIQLADFTHMNYYYNIVAEWGKVIGYVLARVGKKIKK